MWKTDSKNVRSGPIVCVFLLIVAVVILCSFITNFYLKKPLTLEEARQVTLRPSVEGINFDIPLLYMHHLYEKKYQRWPRHKDYKRYELDGIRVTAQLPDMEPYNEKMLNSLIS